MFTSFGIDGLAFAAEALIGEAIGRGNVFPVPHRDTGSLVLDGRFRCLERDDLPSVRHEHCSPDD